MHNRQRGSALIIATIVVLVIAVIGVGMVRFTQHQVAGALAGTRADALSACAAAAQKMLESRFHALSTEPTTVAALNVPLDGPGGRIKALGGHVDDDPAQLLLTVKQVEPLPGNVNNKSIEFGTGDNTNQLSSMTGGSGLGSGAPLKITVHCQEGDLSSPTSGRQLEIEYSVRFGL